MSLAIGAALLLLVVGAMCLVPVRPSIALGLLITLYGVEQVLASLLSFVALNSTLYNYAVGAVSLLAIVIALRRFGVPRPPLAYAALASFFFSFTLLSALWTDAPATAREWLTHFVAEVPICILVPICTLRSYDDFRAPIVLSIAVSALVSLTLLTSPAQELEGRRYLVGLATVLSPAEMTGAAFVLLTMVHRDTLGALAKLRWPLAVILAIALYQSGARGQFLLAIALPVLFILGRRFGAGLSAAMITAIGGVLGLAMVLALAAFDKDIGPVRLGERYTVDSLEEGLDLRMSLIRESLTFDQPIHGHGVAGWSYMHNRSDFASKLDRSRISYPHNSLAHVYFELGLVGLVPFVALIVLTLRQGIALIRYHANAPALQQLAAGMFLYFLFSFGLSLKQNTYLAILGFYLSGASIVALTIRAQLDRRAAAGVSRPELSRGARNV